MQPKAYSHTGTAAFEAESYITWARSNAKWNSVALESWLYISLGSCNEAVVTLMIGLCM